MAMTEQDVEDFLAKLLPLRDATGPDFCHDDCTLCEKSGRLQRLVVDLEELKEDITNHGGSVG